MMPQFPEPDEENLDLYELPSWNLPGRRKLLAKSRKPVKLRKA
jgi:hypothetical protein